LLIKETLNYLSAVFKNLEIDAGRFPLLKKYEPSPFRIDELIVDD
jgi:hypothetical protein